MIRQNIITLINYRCIACLLCLIDKCFCGLHIHINYHLAWQRLLMDEILSYWISMKFLKFSCVTFMTVTSLPPPLRPGDGACYSQQELHIATALQSWIQHCARLSGVLYRAVRVQCYDDTVRDDVTPWYSTTVTSQWTHKQCNAARLPSTAAANVLLRASTFRSVVNQNRTMSSAD